MPEKYKGAPPPIPLWLDPKAESKEITPKLTAAEFVYVCVEVLLSLGCNIHQALSVTANAIVETGWGQFYRANNLGGWKITPQYVKQYRLKYQKCPDWWRAAGNVKSGDEPWCYYRAFPTIQDFLKEWLEHYVPRPDQSAPYTAYRECGAAFWRGDHWFELLIQAGYKGAVTRKNPGPSIHEHDQLTLQAGVFWAQHKLDVAADGQWGPKSRAACAAFQTKAGVNPSGNLDSVTLEALAKPAPVA